MSGLDRRSLGVTDVVAHSVAVMAPCAAGATIPMLVMEAGASLVWSVLGAVVLAALVAIVLREFASRMAAPGGLYTFAAKGLGPVGGIVTAIAMVLGYGALGVFALSQSAFFTLSLLGMDHPSSIQAGLAVIVLGAAVAATLVRGIRLSSRVGLITEAVAVTVVLAAIAVLLTRHSASLDPASIVAAPSSVGSLCVGIAIATCGLIGFESATTVSVEAQRPLRIVPAAIVVSLFLGSLVVLIATVAQAAGTSVLAAVSALSDGNFDVMADSVGAGWVVPIINVGIVASFVACTLATTTSLARTLMSLAREGIVDHRLGRTHPRFKTPAVSILASVAVMSVVAAGAAMFGGSAEAVRSSMAAAPSIGFITAYIVVGIACPLFLRRTGESRPGITAIAVTATGLFGAVLIVFVVISFGTDRAGGVIAALCWYLVAAVGALALWRARPWVMARVGIHETPVRADVWRGHRRPEDASLAGPRHSGPT